MLKGVYVMLAVDGITDNGFVRCEMSKVPTNQIGTNGALDPILEVGVYMNFATSGLAAGGPVNGFYPLSVPCRQGEIVYLHATVSGTATYYFNAILIY